MVFQFETDTEPMLLYLQYGRISLYLGKVVFDSRTKQILLVEKREKDVSRRFSVTKNLF